MPGVKAVLRVPLDRGAEGVAVIADGYWPAKPARDALKLQWDTGAVEKVDSAKQLAQYRELAGQPGARHFDADMARAGRRAEADRGRVRLPLPGARADGAAELHRASWRWHGAELWVGSQMPGLDGVAAARVLGLHARAGAGQRAGRPVAASAAARSPPATTCVEACADRQGRRAPPACSAPVRTLWSREDDIRGGYYRPMHLHRARIGFDAQGKRAGLGPRDRRPVDPRRHALRGDDGQGRHRRHDDRRHATSRTRCRCG